MDKDSYEKKDHDCQRRNFELIHSYGEELSLKGSVNGFFEDLLHESEHN